MHLLRIKVKDQTTGEMVDGEVVKIVEAVEPQSHVTLEDGTMITSRLTISQVVRLVDKWGDDGAPTYSITANGATTVNAPEHLMKVADDA